MSSSLNKFLEKGKAKLKEYSSPPSSQFSAYPGQQQHPPPGAYGYPPQQQQYNQNHPPGPYNNPQQQQGQWQQPQWQQNQQWNPNPQQWQQTQNQPYNPPPPQQYPPYGSPPPLQQQYGYYDAPPPGQQPFSPPPPQFQQQHPLSPPIPQHSKPHSPAPPPIPGNRPPPSPGQHSQPTAPYWQATFNPTLPITHNFNHELGAHGWGNNEAQNYTNDGLNSFHTPDGRLVIRAIAQNGAYTSARLTSHQRLSRSRGFLTVTVQAPSAEGIWPAFWLLPHDPFTWPNDGEVDIFEAWNGDPTNHSCLHWGHFNGEDSQKHRVVETPIPDLVARPHTVGFAWSEETSGPGLGYAGRGRMVWYIDGRAVMKASIPEGIRRLEEFRIIINVAIGGNVCQGKLPRDGGYDFALWDMKMLEEPVGGWGQFEQDWGGVREGHAM